MTTQKLELKIFSQSDNGSELPLAQAIPVFHRWIRESVLDDLLIDVADYRHVPNGPGVLLIAHDAQYSLDSTAGRPGFLYSRRRQTHSSVADAETPAERLRSVFRSALAAAHRLEQEETLAPQLRFPGDELELLVNDRLENGATVREELRPALEGLLAELYPGAEISVEDAGEPRQKPALRIRVSEATDLGTLLERLG